MHRPQRVHSSDRKASRARPRVMPCDRTSARRARYRRSTRSVRVGGGGRWPRPGQQREELGEIVLLPGQGHLAQGGAVVRLHLAHRDRPAVERRLREGHDLGAPDVRETRRRPRRPPTGWRLPMRLDPLQLPDVTEGKIRAVGPASAVALPSRVGTGCRPIRSDVSRVTTTPRPSSRADPASDRRSGSRVAPTSITVTCWRDRRSEPRRRPPRPDPSR